MIYRVTFGFSGLGKGWSETHALLNSSNNPRDLVPTLVAIAQKRVLFLGREFSLIGIRISRYATDAGARARGAFLVKQTFTNPSRTLEYAAEPAAVAYLVRGYAEASPSNPQFDANENQTFLGAPLDPTVDNGGAVDTGKSGLLASFQSWRSLMLGTTMGWLANETIVNTPLLTIASDTDGRIKFTVDPVAIAGLQLGQKYKARVRQVNQGQSPLNGEVQIYKSAADTLKSVPVIGIAYQQVGGSIRVYKQIQPFVDYGDLVLADMVANHKRGRPFGSVPGRAKKRVRG